MGTVSLKILMLYSDRSSAELSKEVSRSLREKLGPAFHIRQSSWNTELLRSSKLRALAAVEAKHSDIVMIALDEGAPISPEVRQWFELWRNRQRGTPAALVALLKRDEEDAPHIVEESLHEFAEEARMDFFCHSELRRLYPRCRINLPAGMLAGAHALTQKYGGQF